MTAGTQFILFQQAKAMLRRYPGRSDEEVAALLGIPERMIMLGDGPGTPADIIRQARKDIVAGASQEATQ